jgi:hypothetical protein
VAYCRELVPYECLFVEVGQGFPSNLLGSRALKLRVLGMVLGAIVPGDALLGC